MNKLFLVLTSFALCLGVNAQKLPEFNKVEKLSFNTSAEEAKPLFSKDGKSMYFVRSYHPDNVSYSSAKQNEDIWKVNRLADSTWSNPVNQKNLNDENNNSLIGVGKSSNHFFLNTYQDNKDLEFGIAVSEMFGEGKWSVPEVIVIPKLKYKGKFYDFFMSKDESTLIISIEGDKTVGQEDLYVSTKVNGEWSEPKSLGKTLNTEGYEFAPYLSDDKKYLFYSSNGREDSYGDADIYVSERLDDTWTNWSEPKNLGATVNSKAMDCYFVSNGYGEYYFSSNRGGQDLNIYQAKQVPVYSKEFVIKGTVKDSTTGEPMSVNIALVNLDSIDENYKVKSDKNGLYEIKVQKERNYKMKILEKKYHEFHDEIKTPKLKSAQLSITYDVLMRPYKKGDEIKLDPLYFVVNTDSLRDISLPIVEKLATILTENPDLKISIEGHTSSDGLKHLNQELSEKRAEKIKELLVKREIKKGRLKTVGYGQSKPKVKNNTEENRRLNRRVEFIILD